MEAVFETPIEEELEGPLELCYVASLPYKHPLWSGAVDRKEAQALYTERQIHGLFVQGQQTDSLNGREKTKARVGGVAGH